MKKKRSKDGWLRIGKKRMRDFGDTDLTKKIIRVNTSKKKNKKKGDLQDTIVHEELHRIHPQAHEKTIRKLTKKKLKKMPSVQKKKLYGRYR